MTGAGRAGAKQAARRINAAGDLLTAGLTVAEAISTLAEQHGISERQARRYVDRVQEVGSIEVPETKVVFTVKLPESVVVRFREYARANRITLSGLATRVLSEFLRDAAAGPDGG